MAGSPDVLTGTFAGRYTIERELGSGATATVYLARDTQRGIAVAVKLLRHELSQSVGAERFLREIRLNEKLHHPHIVPVLDSGEQGGRLFFVLPHMEDGSLRQMLLREKQLPIETAIAITRTIAQALDYAHQQNLIHRDVKPENILFTSGQACLADFGIARALERAIDESTTDSGLVRGTPAYMSPEQASGNKDYDGRSDQYSLACVLYEMLAGVPAFIGPTPEAVIAQRFQHQPRELRVYRSAVSTAIEDVLIRALSMAPADRYASAAEFAGALAAASRAKPESGHAAPPDRRNVWKAPAIIGVSAAVSVLAVTVALAINGRDAASEPVSFVVPPPTGARFSDNLRDVSAVSPDGRDIIIAGTDSAGVRHLWRRRLADRTALRIPGTEFGGKALWSPDGKSIGFFQRGRLAVIDRSGGVARTIVATTQGPRGGSWADNQTILYAPGSQSGIHVVSLADGKARQVTAPSMSRGEIGHMWPQALPGGTEFIYYVASPVDSVRGVYLGSITSQQGRRLVGSSASAIYSNGQLLYLQDGALVAHRLDVSRAALVGNSRVIADSVAASFEYYGAFSASESGVLVYVGGSSRDITRMTWFDTTGTVQGFASAPGYMRNPDLSPDGRLLAYETYREAESDIRTVDLRTGITGLVPDGGTQALDPVWLSDGTSLAFVAEQPGGWALFRKRIDRADEPELLLRSPKYMVLMDWAESRQSFIVAERSASDWDLVARAIADPGKAQLLAGGRGHQVAGKLSADGQHLAYVSTESGTPQLFVQRVDGSGIRCQVSVTGGHQPVWGAGSTIYFLTSSGMMMRAEIDRRRANLCPTAAPRALFDTQIRNPSSDRSFFDYSVQARRFLVNAPSIEEAAWLNVMLNWTSVPAAPR